MPRMDDSEWTRMNAVIKSIQRKFVVDCLADLLQPDNGMDSLDTLVPAIVQQCSDRGVVLHPALVRELVIEIAEKLGFPGGAK